MRRVVFFIYGGFSHALFLGVFAWMVAFIGNWRIDHLPTLDAPAAGSPWAAIALDTLLILAFVVPHSVMARPGFKRWWTQYVPQPIERSTYVLVSCVLMGLLLWQWRPIGGVVWDVTNPAGYLALRALFFIGVLVVPGVSLLINHFDLFGTRQVWLHLRGKAYSHPPFRTPLVYRFIRHPLYIGWMIMFWASPTMTAAHLLFAVLNTAYMLAAIPFEERDLIAEHGESYAEYRRQVPALIPRLGTRELAAEPTVEISVQ